MKKILKKKICPLLVAILLTIVWGEVANAQVLPIVCKVRGALGTTPARGTTGILPDRVRRAGTATTCSSTAVPNPFNEAPGSYLYNTHTLTNPTIFPICIPVRLSKTNPSVSGADLNVAVFQNPFTAADITNLGRFRGDAGVSTGAFAVHQPTSFNVTIPGNSSISLVVYNTVSGSTAAEPYEIDFCTTTTAYAGAPVAIPDVNPSGVNINLPVSTSGRITDVNFRFPTGPNACNATLGNTNSAVDHSFVGDLNLRLSAPGGFPSALFWERRGGTRENICLTGIDDEGSFPALSTITNTTGQFVSGNFSPETTGRMSRFDGEGAQGTWVLNVSDNAADDTGSVRRFALEITTAPLKAQYDYDGDARADLSIYRPSAGEWWHYRSSNNQVRADQFGTAEDLITPADFTGDGIADYAFFRPSTGFWFVLRSEDYSFYSFPFGTSGDLPSTGDFDGDTFADHAIFRPSEGRWYIIRSTGAISIDAYGSPGDVPVPADYDGDGKTDLAVYRPSNGVWYYRRSENGSDRQIDLGISTDIPLPGDYDGDGSADAAVWRPSTGVWSIRQSSISVVIQFQFGTTGDIPAPADYDGDRKFDPTVYRPNGGFWYSLRSQSGSVVINQFGLPGDQPTQSFAGK